MNKRTDITVVLDRSGSMGNIRQETESSYNNFVTEQRKLDGECKITLVQFDDKYEPNYSEVDIHDPKAILNGYQPRGYTALHDAIGKTIVSTGERLSSKKVEDRPELVIFVILTDGLENASREYNGARIKEMISHQQSAYNWQFTFLGANQDAITTAKDIGIPAMAAMTYTPTGAGIGATGQSLNSVIRSVRTGAKSFLSYSPEDRKKQEDLLGGRSK